LKPFLASSSTS